VDWIDVAQNRSECSADVNTKQYTGLIKVGECVSDWIEWHIARTLTVPISCDSLQWLASSIKAAHMKTGYPSECSGM
jgi:hypothetical protein